MKAVILCSNEGTRLRPVTCTMPVAMLPVLGRPIAEHTVRLLRKHGIKEVTFTTGYLSGEIEKHFSTIKLEDIKISFSPIEELSALSEDDTIILSDITLTDIDFSEIIRIFEKRKLPLLITKPDGEDNEFGRVYTDASFVTKDILKVFTLQEVFLRVFP